MFAKDQYRDWKVDQREFRNVEEALLQREVLGKAPAVSQIAEVEKAQQEVAEARKNLEQKRAEVQAQVNAILPDKVKSENKFANIKADLDSKDSFYNIAIDKRSRPAEDPTRYAGLQENVDQLAKEVLELRSQLLTAQTELDANRQKLDEAMKPVTEAEARLSKAEDRLKELVGEFDRFHRLAEQKQWGGGDWFRSLPVIDAFNSPIRIQQYTLEQLPIDYSFKYVTRYDRCTTCHMGIDRAMFDRDALLALREPPSHELQEQMDNAKISLRVRRRVATDKASLDPNDLALSTVKLSDAQVSMFAAHPRLDLFVEANSPHAAEKFGCTICHQGQGSGTAFNAAAHSPNDSAQARHWEEHWHFHRSHYWDYPMLPARFIESSCVKCHHQMTDLIRHGTKNEAPKLLKGYNLVRDNGCFGCHEISGFKGGRQIGPDLRSRRRRWTLTRRPSGSSC
jgi:hypothetical protein